jgi:hypothetical protein
VAGGAAKYHHMTEGITWFFMRTVNLKCSTTAEKEIGLIFDNTSSA